MANEQLDTVRKIFSFKEWQGINRLDHELVVTKIDLPKDLIAGLDTERVREIDPGDGSRLLRITWQPPENKEALLIMDIRECKSRNAAHEVLLELLANIQAPDVKRLENNPLGDVAFARDMGAAVIFARGNIAVSIHNGGKTTEPVDEIANTIDHWIKCL